MIMLPSPRNSFITFFFWSVFCLILHLQDLVGISTPLQGKVIHLTVQMLWHVRSILDFCQSQASWYCRHWRPSRRLIFEGRRDRLAALVEDCRRSSRPWRPSCRCHVELVPESASSESRLMWRMGVPRRESWTPSYEGGTRRHLVLPGNSSVWRRKRRHKLTRNIS